MDRFPLTIFSVGRHLVVEGEVAHQVLGLRMVEKLGRVMDALEISEGQTPAARH